MKNKVLKKLVMLVLALSMVITLCACGGDSSATNGSEGNKGSESSKNSQVVGESESESEKDKIVRIPISKCFNDESMIWYKVGTPGKDAIVQAVYVFKDGKLYCYNRKTAWSSNDALVYDGITLGELAKLTDEEIVKKVEDELCLKMKQLVEREKIAYETLMKDIAEGQEYYTTMVYENGSQWEISVPVSLMKEYYASLDEYVSTKWFEMDTELALYTDATGNNLDREELTFKRKYSPNFECFFECLVNNQFPADAEYDGEAYGHKVIGICPIKEVEDVVYETCSLQEYDMIAGGAYEVYQSVYGGFSADGMKYLTRVEESVFFELDSLGTEGIEIDPEKEQEEESGTEEW